jgi:hypothetical protein
MTSITELPEGNPKELRKFAMIMFIGFGVLGALVLWRRGETGFALWGIGVLILAMGFIRPAILGPIYRGWMVLAMTLGLVMTHLILAVIYYVVFTPTGMVMRMVGRDPLQLKFDRNSGSYWIKKQSVEFTREQYERMF